MINVRQLTHAYDSGEPVLSGLDFHIGTGEKVVLLGANGCGKTTLLKILDGLIFPRTGGWEYKGRAVTRAGLRDREFHRRFRQEVALLFQNPEAMIFNPTVADEIAFGPRQLGLPDVEERVRKYADLLGLTPLLGRPPFQLSGGEKQKICLAALLAQEPQLLLMDEPTARMDPRSTGWLVDFLQDLRVTTVVTTHNLSLAGELGERTLLLAEDHRLIYDGALAPLLEDYAKLAQANLIHRHRHRHEGVEHRHDHWHEWK